MSLTLIAYDTRDHELLMDAIRKTWAQMDGVPSIVETVVFTDKPEYFPGCKCLIIEPFKSIEETSAFDVCDLPKWILGNTSTSHTLHIQADGFVLNGKAWLDEWLDYDFIGAPWLFCCGGHGHAGRPEYGHMGNDGFSLRSRAFHERVANRNIPREYSHPADWVTSSAQPYMEGIKFAPWHVGMRFSAEDVPYTTQFGYHGRYTQSTVKAQNLYE